MQNDSQKNLAAFQAGVDKRVGGPIPYCLKFNALSGISLLAPHGVSCLYLNSYPSSSVLTSFTSFF